MQIAQSVRESYEKGYAEGKAGSDPTINSVDTDEGKGYLVGYLDGFFGYEHAPQSIDLARMRQAEKNS